jgi:hypothetical protein
MQQKPNDQRSVVKNPNNQQHKHAQDNRSGQLNQKAAPTGGAGLPSKTGEPSGKGRDNAPPRK